MCFSDRHYYDVNGGMTTQVLAHFMCISILRLKIKIGQNIF